MSLVCTSFHRLFSKVVFDPGALPAEPFKFPEETTLQLFLVLRAWHQLMETLMPIRRGVNTADRGPTDLAWAQKQGLLGCSQETATGQDALGSIVICDMHPHGPLCRLFFRSRKPLYRESDHHAFTAKRAEAEQTTKTASTCETPRMRRHSLREQCIKNSWILLMVAALHKLRALHHWALCCLSFGYTLCMKKRVDKRVG